MKGLDTQEARKNKIDTLIKTMQSAKEQKIEFSDEELTNQLIYLYGCTERKAKEYLTIAKAQIEYLKQNE